MNKNKDKLYVQCSINYSPYMQECRTIVLRTPLNVGILILVSLLVMPLLHS